MTRRLRAVTVRANRVALGVMTAGIGVGAWHAHLHQLLQATVVDGGGRFFT